MLMVLASCRGGSDKPLLPNVSGKAGEVIVVMDKSDWDGNLGGETRGVLAADYPFLPQRDFLHCQCSSYGICGPFQDTQEYTYI